MIEIDSASLLSKEPLKIRFTSDEFGLVGLARKCSAGDFVALARGIAIELKDEVKTRSVVKDGLNWYSFKARSLGFFFSRHELHEKIIARLAEENPDMVLRSWDDIEAEHSHRLDFKRSKRPFLAIETWEGPTWAVFWEYYPALGRIGVYIGKDDKGLGGYVCFYDREEFKVL